MYIYYIYIYMYVLFYLNTTQIYFYTKKDKRGKYSRMVEGSNLDYNNYTQYPISIRPSLLSGNLSFTGEDMLYISNAEPGARCAIVCIKYISNIYTIYIYIYIETWRETRMGVFYQEVQ